jgi:hypothetical protein
LRPVLRLGASRAGLDVHEAVVRVERIGEHAAELEVRDDLLRARDVGLDRGERGGVVLLAREREELGGVLQLAVQIGERADEVVELLFLAPQLLGALRVRPDVRLLELPAYFGEAGLLGVEVKDTSATQPSACRGRRAWRKVD